MGREINQYEFVVNIGHCLEVSHD